jgi:hypothetical protein
MLYVILINFGGNALILYVLNIDLLASLQRLHPLSMATQILF